MLEDLVVAAHADARRKLEAVTAEEMQKVAGGLNLPPRHDAALLGADATARWAARRSSA